MNNNELKNRTKTFALRVMKLVEHLPNNKTGNIIANQILRSGTSVGQTIEQLAEPVQKQILFLKLLSSKKKPTKPSFGLKLLSSQG